MKRKNQFKLLENTHFTSSSESSAIVGRASGSGTWYFRTYVQAQREDDSIKILKKAFRKSIENSYLFASGLQL